MKQHSLLTLIIAGILVGCGGGGGGGGGGGVTSTTTSTSVINTSSTSTSVNNTSSTSSAQANDVVQGMITGFGSVVVNGVHFEVDEARIDEDGDSRVESDLKVGQLVKITGTIDSDGLRGKATKLRAATQVRGPISSIDLTAGIIVVLGQTLLITGDTFYDEGLTAASLKVGDVIKVSSNANSDGTLSATRIEVKTGTEANNQLLSGTIANLNTTTMTYTLNGVTVDYSKATIADLPNKTIANGLLVRVHGSLENNIFVANGNVHLSALDLKHDGELDAEVSVEMSGLITQLDLPLGESSVNPSFMLGTTKVFFATNADIKGGTLANFENDLRVRVKGTFDADKNLVAEKIILILNTEADLEGLVQATDPDKNTLTLNGVTFEITPDTSFNDRSEAQVRLFDLDDLVTGDFIEVRGYRLAATASTPERIIATRFERKDLSEKDEGGFKSEFSGTVDAVNGDIIEVSGHSIKITSSTQMEGFDTIQAFLNGALGLDMEIEAFFENNVFVARVIEVEDDDDSNHSSSKSSSSHSSSSEAWMSSISSAASSPAFSSSINSVSSSGSGVSMSSTSSTASSLSFSSSINSASSSGTEASASSISSTASSLDVSSSINSTASSSASSLTQ